MGINIRGCSSVCQHMIKEGKEDVDLKDPFEQKTSFKSNKISNEQKNKYNLVSLSRKNNDNDDKKYKHLKRQSLQSLKKDNRQVRKSSFRTSNKSHNFASDSKLNNSCSNAEEKEERRNGEEIKKFAVNQSDKRLVYQISPCKNNKNINDFINKSDEEGVTVPCMKINLINQNFIANDPFIKGIRNKDLNRSLLNDPRDGPFDDQRRNFPKIIEDCVAYEGEWKNGERDGLGMLFFEDETIFQGYFRNNKINGYGVCNHNDGEIYEGFWVNFKANGFGLYKNRENAIYKGEWCDDKQHGFGIEKWPKGSSFQGMYYEDNREGIGILRFDKSIYYEGEFNNGLISGIGTFYFSDGRKYQGEWKNNKMHGYGIITWSNGSYFEGRFCNDKKVGLGIYYSEKKIYIGYLEDNVLNGEVIIIKDHKIKRQFWSKGKPEKNLGRQYRTKYENILVNLLIEMKHDPPG